MTDNVRVAISVFAKFTALDAIGPCELGGVGTRPLACDDRVLGWLGRAHATTRVTAYAQLRC